MLSFITVFLTFASLSFSAPINSAADSVTDNPSYNSSIVWSPQNGSTTSCGVTPLDTDIVVTLPSAYFNQSKDCLQWVVLTNLALNHSIIAQVIGSSDLNDTFGSTKATWQYLGGDSSNLTSWRFAYPAETALVVTNLINQERSRQAAAESLSSAVATSVPSTPVPTPTHTHTSATPAYTPAPSPTSVVAVEVTSIKSAAPVSTPAAQLAAAPASSSSAVYSGIATFFTQNGVAGSCGTVHSDSTYLVAIQAALYEASWCGRSIEITRTSTGKTISAIVADTCPGCSTSQSLDLSTGAFDALGSPSEGIFAMTWRFV